jgi:hypothetical protein
MITWTKNVDYDISTVIMSYNSTNEVCTRGDHWAKIVEQRAILNRVQYIHCR